MLSKYLVFDLGKFLKEKQLELANASEHRTYIDGKPGDVDGVSLKVAVVKDTTDYGKPGVSNLYQMFTIRINGANLDDVTDVMKPGDPIQLKRYKKATVYGQYRDQLSVQIGSIDDIKVG